MRRDPTEFRQRFAAWKDGENYWDTRGEDMLPEYSGGKTGFYNTHRDKWRQFLISKGVGAEQADRLSVYFAAQDSLESGGGTSSAARQKNNFGGMQRGGKNISYDTVQDYMNDKWNMMNKRFSRALNAKTVQEYATLINDPKYAGKGYLYAVADGYNQKNPQDRAWVARQIQHMNNYTKAMMGIAGQKGFVARPVPKAPVVSKAEPIQKANPIPSAVELLKQNELPVVLPEPTVTTTQTPTQAAQQAQLSEYIQKPLVSEKVPVLGGDYWENFFNNNSLDQFQSLMQQQMTSHKHGKNILPRHADGKTPGEYNEELVELPEVRVDRTTGDVVQDGRRGSVRLPEIIATARDPRKPVPTANVLNPSSLSLSNFLDKNKIYNRIPGDEWYNVVNEDRKSNYGISGPFDALQAYFLNDDDYVLNRLSRYMPYKDISWREKEKAAQDFDEENRKVKYKFNTLSDTAKHRLEMLQDKSEALPVLQHEDAKAVYLGLPQRTNTLRDAEYNPTQGKLNNGKYITYMREPTFVEDVLMPIYNDLKLGRKRIGGKKIAGEVLSLPKYANSIEEITPKGNAVVHIPFLNNATMSSGHDGRGEYLSIFDTWDYNTDVYAKPGDNIGKHIDGKPFDIYDRIYLDDYFGMPKEYRGSTYIPELIVTANKYANGKNPIRINPANRGKFNALKKRTGKTTEQLTHSKNPLTRKRAIFAQNAAKWRRK